LELIDTAGNVPVVNGKYRMDITIPSGRSGDAILFVRWQRVDPVGEGFYNCSDITITAGEVTPPEVDPDPVPQLFRGDLFVPAGLEPPAQGDVVSYDIINKNGQIARTFDIEIDAFNVSDWARLLAADINGWHQEFKDGAVFIGDWHQEMQHYMYFQNDPTRNFFNSRDSRASAVMTVTRVSSNEPGPLDVEIYELSESDNVVTAGAKVIVQTPESALVVQTQGTPVPITSNPSSAVIIDTAGVAQAETLVFSASSVSGQLSQSFAFEVLVEDSDIPPPVAQDAWDPVRTYLGGELVSYGGQQWKAQWWVRGGADPASVYAGDIWGVWRPAN
ncbi:MAG: lytic polysaccharide monooxygenase, partial [Pseudomonadota bacterium]